MSNITDKFIDYLFLKASYISDTIKSKAENCYQDYMAVALAGAKKNEQCWIDVMARCSVGKASVLGYEKTIDGRTAAFINGFNAHSLELDDGQRFAMIHLGASIISAILSAKAENDMTDDRMKIGIIMGYEAACRISIAMQPSHKKCGYHAAGTCGTIGAAIGTAFALSMDKKQMKCVLTAAAGSAAGMLEIQEQNSEMKPFNLGCAAMNGLNAAYMGFAIFAPPDDMIGGERGFLNTFSDEYNNELLTERHDYFEIERIYVKPYASCRHSHSAVEAAIHMYGKFDASQIRNIIVETYRLGVKGHDHTSITSIASAKLSTPYAVAAALLYGKADLTVFEPIDLGIVELTKKVRVNESAELTKECPLKRIAVVTVELDDGRVFSYRVNHAKGEPENPMTESDMQEKIELLEKYRNHFDERN